MRILQVGGAFVKRRGTQERNFERQCLELFCRCGQGTSDGHGRAIRMFFSTNYTALNQADRGYRGVMIRRDG